jgi:hypothetical protein
MVRSIVGEPIEKRYVAGHFYTGNCKTFDTKKPFIKGYFLAPTPKLERAVQLEATGVLTKNLETALKEEASSDFSGLGTAVVSPVSGYWQLLLWKESNPIEYYPFSWHREENKEIKRIPFAPCSRELTILGLEAEHYTVLLRSKCTEDDLKKYAERWLPLTALV